MQKDKKQSTNIYSTDQTQQKENPTTHSYAKAVTSQIKPSIVLALVSIKYSY